MADWLPALKTLPTEIESIHIAFQMDAHFQSLQLLEWSLGYIPMNVVTEHPNTAVPRTDCCFVERYHFCLVYFIIGYRPSWQHLPINTRMISSTEDSFTSAPAGDAVARVVVGYGIIQEGIGLAALGRM